MVLAVLYIWDARVKISTKDDVVGECAKCELVVKLFSFYSKFEI